MRALVTVALVALAAWSIASGWPILSVPLGMTAYYLVNSDTGGASIEEFGAYCLMAGIMALVLGAVNY